MAERNRITSPSINFPQSPEEAFQALLHRSRRALFEDTAYGDPVLKRAYTTDAGLGAIRSQKQADWLNEQQSLLRARLEDFLDQLDLESRI
jgi:hypothetical protein